MPKWVLFNWGTSSPEPFVLPFAMDALLCVGQGLAPAVANSTALQFTAAVPLKRTITNIFDTVGNNNLVWMSPASISGWVHYLSYAVSLNFLRHEVHTL
jgi:hypothetical protein